MMSTDDKPETEKQRKAEKRRCEKIEADRKRKKKQEDQQEQLLIQQKIDSEVELEEYEMEEYDLGNQEMEEEEEDMFALSSVMVKEQEEEARRVVDALLEERLGEFTLNSHNRTSNQHLCPPSPAASPLKQTPYIHPKFTCHSQSTERFYSFLSPSQV